MKATSSAAQKARAIETVHCTTVRLARDAEAVGACAALVATTIMLCIPSAQRWGRRYQRRAG